MKLFWMLKVAILTAWTQENGESTKGSQKRDIGDLPWRNCIRKTLNGNVGYLHNPQTQNIIWECIEFDLNSK